MQNKKIAFIGAGSMATSLITGLINDGYDPKLLYASNPTPEKLALLQQQTGIHTNTNNLKVAEVADIIVLAVKPKIIKEVAEELRHIIIKNQPLIISVAAGVKTEKILKYVGYDIALVRCMPNTPAAVATGATGLYANPYVTPAQKEFAESLLRSVGMTIWLTDEKLLDSITALSGCGPAYFFLFMEILQRIGVKLGLDAETTRLLTLQTALGSAKLALETDLSFQQLRRRVTSPGGTTEAALNILLQENFEKLIENAVFQAKIRAEELAELY